MRISPARFPWPLFLLLVTLLYGAFFVRTWLLPCQDSLFIGLCGSGKLLVIILHSFWLAAYGLFVLIIRAASARQKPGAVNRWATWGGALCLFGLGLYLLLELYLESTP